MRELGERDERFCAWHTQRRGELSRVEKWGSRVSKREPTTSKDPVRVDGKRIRTRTTMMLSTALRCASAGGGRRIVVGSSFLSTSYRSLSSSGAILLKDSYEHVLAEKKENGTVGLITLHRPSALNALSEDLFTDLLHAAKAFDQDEQIGCLVVTGSTKAFAAGADIKEMSDITFAEAFGQVRPYFLVVVFGGSFFDVLCMRVRVVRSKYSHNSPAFCIMA
jgi:hypothetical protein